jgi:Fe-S-cluster containining protein
MMVETFYAHLQFTNKKGKWSINLPFVCSKCGVCCTLDDFLTAGQVKINPLENPQLQNKIEALHDEIGKIWEVSEEKYDRFITHTKCPFLVNKTCSIYAVRPEGCRHFPNTKFGMLTEDCEALDRFKKQCSTLKRGRKVKETFYFTTTEPIKQAKFTEEQFSECSSKLRSVGITDEELDLFRKLNSKKA